MAGDKTQTEAAAPERITPLGLTHWVCPSGSLFTGGGEGEGLNSLSLSENNGVGVRVGRPDIDDSFMPLLTIPCFSLSFPFPSFYGIFWLWHGPLSKGNLLYSTPPLVAEWGSHSIRVRHRGTTGQRGKIIVSYSALTLIWLQSYSYRSEGRSGRKEEMLKDHSQLQIKYSTWLYI